MLTVFQPLDNQPYVRAQHRSRQIARTKLIAVIGREQAELLASEPAVNQNA
jgi:hypothetical protein